LEVTLGVLSQRDFYEKRQGCEFTLIRASSVASEG